MLCLSLFLGGFETTVAQLGSTFYVLMAQPALWQELLDAPGVRPAALEELWRWIPSTRYGMPLVRWAIEDVELSREVVIPAGQPILPERAVANRDESVFPDGWSSTSTGTIRSRTCRWASARTTASARASPTSRSRSPWRRCSLASRASSSRSPPRT